MKNGLLRSVSSVFLPILFSLLIKEAVGQTAIANPPGTTVSYSSTDSRAFGFPNGMTITYTNANFPTCLGWGLPKNAIPIINGSILPAASCSTLSTVNYTASAPTDLAGGIACWTGTTTYRASNGSSYGNYSVSVRLRVTITNASNQAIPFAEVGNYIMAAVPSGNSSFKVKVEIQAQGPSGPVYYTSGTGTTTIPAPAAGFPSNSYTCANYSGQWVGAIQLYNCMATDNSYLICTQFPGTANSYVFYNGTSSATSPAFSGSSPAHNSTQSSSAATFQWTGTMGSYPSSRYEYSFNGGTWTSKGSLTSQAVTLNTGSNTFCVRYYDGCTNTYRPSASGVCRTVYYAPNTGCGSTINHYGNDWAITSNTTVSGIHTNVGSFSISSGVTATVETGCEFYVSATNVNIAGTIDANGRGHAAGSGGGTQSGSSGISCGANGNASTSGGNRGLDGSGAGNGKAATSNGSNGLGCSQDCGSTQDYAGIIKGAGGAGGGGGGAYGGNGSVGGKGGNGGSYSSSSVTTNLGYCSNGFNGGMGSDGGSAGTAYGSQTDQVIDFGSGGAGAGGGGRGNSAGSAGSSGGRGGGKVTIESRANTSNPNSPYTFNFTGYIYANGANGSSGGAGGASGRGSTNCCSDGCNEAETEEANNVTGGGGGGGAGAGSGGGVMFLINGNSNLTGTINANGGNGGAGGGGGASSTSTYGGGGFCGGSQTINNGAGGSGGAGGNGGGGRIKIFRNPCYNHTGTPTMSVLPGSSGNGTAGSGTTHIGNINTYSALSASTINTTNQTICQGGSVLLDGAVPTGGTGGYSYQWYYSTTHCGSPATGGASAPATGWSAITGATGEDLSAAQMASVIGSATGTYCFQRRNQSGACYSWTVARTVTVRPTPTVSISGTTTVCQNGASPNITFTNPQPLAVTVTYKINGGANQTVNVNASSNATVAVNTSSSGTFTYSLVSVVYQTSPTCSAAVTGSATVTVNAQPNTFTVNIGTNTPLCHRGMAPIEVISSQSGVNYVLRENTTNVGSQQTGNGSTLTFLTNSLNANNTNYNVLATNSLGCTLSVNVGAITVDALPNAYAGNNESRTCYVNGNAYVEFRSANGVMLSINPNGQELGEVQVTQYAEAPVGIQACGTNQPWYETMALGRHWVITPEFQPSNPVNLRFYFDNSDYTALASAANSNANPNDDVVALGSLDLSKYSNTANPSVVNGVFTDNCNSGGSSAVYIPYGYGNITSLAGYGGFLNTGLYTEYSFTGFSEFWLSGTNNVSPLPIELISFTASCVDGMVYLKWETATETNNAQFVIERSGDMQSWEQLTTVAGAGNSNQPLQYQVVDERPNGGLSYYRLTQKDFDGSAETFEPISIICYSDGKGNSMTVSPNPADGKFVVAIHMQHTIDAQIEIVDMSGKVLLTRNVTLPQGISETVFERMAIPSGQYTIQLKSESVVIKPIKLVIQ